MIRNLNQLNFSGFGTISPERPPSSEDFSKPAQRTLLQLQHRDAPIYRAASDTWLCSSSGMTVLSVSTDAEEFQHFYLDKPVCVDEGIYFCLSPFRQNTSAAELSADLPPVYQNRRQKINDFQVSHKLRVSALYTFFYHEKERGFFFPGESHPMLELTYVDQGSLHSVADGQDLVLSQGDMVLYGPDQWHMQYADIQVAPRFVTASFTVSGSLPESLFNRVIRVPQEALGILGRILREQEQADGYSDDMILSLLTQLLISLQRNLEDAPGKLRMAHSVHSENAIISRAQQYIGTHVRQKLTVPLVARQVDVSPSYLTALFHKHLKIAPGEYIRRIKLQESKQMIRENTMNFTEIAAALQYSTVHHFSRQFKEKFGITPSEYAKSVR